MEQFKELSQGDLFMTSRKLFIKITDIAAYEFNCKSFFRFHENEKITALNLRKKEWANILAHSLRSQR